jgi:hypothetical protein
MGTGVRLKNPISLVKSWIISNSLGEISGGFPKCLQVSLDFAASAALAAFFIAFRFFFDGMMPRQSSRQAASRAVLASYRFRQLCPCLILQGAGTAVCAATSYPFPLALLLS